MKKKFVSLIAILASTALIVSCNEETSSETPNNSSGNNYGDISNDISSDSSSSSEDIVNSGLDKMIAEFVSDTDVKVPSTASYNISDYEVLYYYAYEQYLIYAEVEDVNESIADEYAAMFTAETNLVSMNDEDYSVEEYGYFFGDSAQNIVVNFYSQNSIFFLTVYRYDGLAGTLDVSKVDTNWYVDYINFDGYELVETSITSLIPNYLGITASITVPAMSSTPYVAGISDPSTGGTGSFVPGYVSIVLEGDKITDYADALEKAGYHVDIYENTGTTIDWDTFEIVDYTYYTVNAYDNDKNIFISIELDESENTMVNFFNFDDLFVKAKTTDTDWTDTEKELMNSTLHQVLPFMAFGEDYLLYDDSDDEWTLLVLEDTYYEDLSEDYIKLLLDNGYTKDDFTWDDTFYVLDNGNVYIEIYVGYEGGNYLEIYYEPSHLEPLTSLSLNQTSLDIVSGASYQLEAIYDPTTATHPITWTSSNENIATVDNNGLVTINSGATVDSAVTITASTLSGKSASCTFTVKANNPTGVIFNKDSFDIIPGGEKIKVSYSYLPYGSTSSTLPTFSVEPSDVGIHVDSNGDLWADETVAVGVTATLKISFNGTEKSATVKVVSATITNTLTGGFFGIKEGETNYNTYKKTVDGATYEAQASAGNDADNGKGLQIRSKNSNSGVIGNCNGRTCKSITFSFDARTEVPNKSRYIEIYASNTPFAITDMYGSNVTKVGTITFDKNNLVQTYTFTDDYAYIGFRSGDGAVYLKSVEVVW